MDRRMKKKGLVIVAPEVQGSPDDAIKKLVDKTKISYTVTRGIRGPNLSDGIPHMAVFDVSGKLIFSGHPADPESEKVIKKALREVEDSNASTSGLGAIKKDLVAMRAWNNAEGRTMQAKLIEVSGTTGQFQFSNGRRFEYDISKLSEADQEIIKKAQNPEASK